MRLSLCRTIALLTRRAILAFPPPSEARVVLHSLQSKMCGVHTTRAGARVVGCQAARDLTTEDGERDPVCPVGTTSHPELAITLSGDVPLPEPTIPRPQLDLGEESLDDLQSGHPIQVCRG